MRAMIGCYLNHPAWPEKVTTMGHPLTTTTEPVLSCGHPPSPHGDHATGTAIIDGREVCWTCADVAQREAMRTAPEFVGYLNGDGTTITSWSGGVLAAVTASATRRVGFGGSRLYLTAIDPTGKPWYGSTAGRGMVCRLRATKGWSHV